MKTSLIISTYNRADALESVLVSVCNLLVQPHQVIIADDGSTSETEIMIHKYQKLLSIPLLHVWHPDNGFRLSEIRNKALALVKSGYVIMIDGDMILDPYFIMDHLFFAKKGFFIQGKRFLLTEKKTNEILKYPQNKFSPRWGDSDIEYRFEKRLFAFRSLFLSRLTRYESNYKHKGIRACNISFNYDDLIKVNGFNNLFIGWGREDSELVERLFNSGVKRIDLAFSALAYHLHHKFEPRASLPKNNILLKEAISKKSTWCEDGLSKYLESSCKTYLKTDNSVMT